MSDNYILKGHEPVPCEDILEWGKWFETGDRTVAKSRVKKMKVSTVFLDHNFGGGQPILFETMIFGGKHDMFQRRYHTWQEAEDGHREIVARLTAGEDPEGPTS